MLFASWKVRMVKNCDQGLENTARHLSIRERVSKKKSVRAFEKQRELVWE